MRERTLKNACIYCVFSDCMLNCDTWDNLYSVNGACGDCSTDVTGLGLKAQKTLEIKGFRWISSNEEGLPESLFALLTIVLTTGFQRGEAE